MRPLLPPQPRPLAPQYRTASRSRTDPRLLAVQLQQLGALDRSAVSPARPGRRPRHRHQRHAGGDRQTQYQQPEWTGSPPSSRQHRAAILTINDAFGSKNMKIPREKQPGGREPAPGDLAL